MKNGWKLLISLAIPVVGGFLSGQFTETGAGSWYRQIERPDWNPPGWVFGPVWTLLYGMMGYALYLIWTAVLPGKRKRGPLILWSVQLALNFFWTYLFFGRQQIAGALLQIVVLWLFILLTIFSFARISRTAAWLLVPYISWVTFATLLTYAIWQLNR